MEQTISLRNLWGDSWRAMRGLKALIWLHFLTGVLVSIFILVGLRSLTHSPEMLAIIQGPYMPLYALVMLIFVPFTCFAIKTVIEKRANRPCLAGYMYASVRSMLPAYCVGLIAVLLFFASHALQVWGFGVFPAPQALALSTFCRLFQLFLLLLSGLAMTASLRHQCNVLQSLSRGWSFFKRNAAVLLLSVLLMCVMFFLVIGMAATLVHSLGQSGGLLGFLIRAAFEIIIIPYVVVMFGLLDV